MVGPVKPVYHSSWVTVVSPIDRPKSVHDSCEIELFGDVFVSSGSPFDISVDVGAFARVQFLPLSIGTKVSSESECNEESYFRYSAHTDSVHSLSLSCSCKSASCTS